MARETAKKYKVPVIMDTSDRGMIDIERFDLEPNRSIMHGLVEEVSYTQIMGMTKTEKLPITMKLAGIFDLSPRLKASMMELDETITTWPQLASAVNYGGGITCDLSRKILLNQITISGRFYLDYAAQFASNAHLIRQELYVEKDEVLTKEYMLNIVNSLSNIEGKDFPSNEQIEQLVETANMAPSGGNSQPWKWLYNKGVLHLFHESSLSKSLLDYSNFGSYLAFGAVLYNLELAAHNHGYTIQYQFYDSAKSKLIYSIVFEKSDIEKNDLYDYIPLRQTNRNKGTQKIWDAALEKPLKEAAYSIEGCELNIISDRNLMEKLAAISAAGERWRILDRQGHYDTFVEELRWTEEEIEHTE
ncbi:MAG: nitroreductase family protein, partial [Bacteroidetes bacterium]|nr:nitroreductase family protein [Bacteroidota bacterium]